MKGFYLLLGAVALIERPVADPHRARPGVAGKLVDGPLRQVAAPTGAFRPTTGRQYRSPSTRSSRSCSSSNPS